MPISLQKECSPEKPGGNQECEEMKERKMLPTAHNLYHGLAQFLSLMLF